jgi:hypothetical protein
VALALDPALLSSFEKDALLATLLAQVDDLVTRVAALETENETENAALREKLEAPPKVPSRVW